ncbi:hypothetical protein ACYCFK_09280 [Stutzerimonas stutzeri]
MMAWLTRYLTKTNLLMLFLSTSLLCFLLAVAIHLVGNYLWGMSQFSRLVEDAMPWFLPFRALFYIITARYWWRYCRATIRRSCGFHGHLATHSMSI